MEIIVKKSESKTTKETVIMTKKEKPFKNVKLFIIYKLGKMTKAELRKVLQVYSKISKDIKQKKKETVCTHYGRRYVILIPEWAWLLNEFIEIIIASEQDGYFSTAIRNCYVKGQKDKTVLSELPLSESTYYRWKRKFEEKLYELYINAGLVSKSEIINNKILE